MRSVSRLVAVFVLVFLASPLRAQGPVLVSPPPQVVASGQAFEVAPEIRVPTDSGSLAGKDVILSVRAPSGANTSTSAVPPHLTGSRVAVTDENGRARFPGLALVGRAGEYVLSFRVAGGDSVEADVRLTAGEATALEVVEEPKPGSPAGKIPEGVWKVRLVDGAGNQVARSGVDVSASLASERARLQGTTTVKTDRKGMATFSQMMILGAEGDYAVAFSGEGLRSDVAKPVTMDRPDFDSHLVIGAIKTISGQDPEDEFLDLNFTFPLQVDSTQWTPCNVLSKVPVLRRIPPCAVFSLATIDVALNAAQAEQVGLVEEEDRGEQGENPAQVPNAGEGSGREITEASISLNFMKHPTNSGARKAFWGATGRIFNGDFFLGGHFGSIELGSSALHGSHLLAGYLQRLDDLPDSVMVADGTLGPQRLGKDNLYISFLARSDSAPFLNVLNIRGTVIIPLGVEGDPEIQSRIVLSVPFADLFQISRGH